MECRLSLRNRMSGTKMLAWHSLFWMHPVYLYTVRKSHVSFLKKDFVYLFVDRGEGREKK